MDGTAEIRLKHGFRHDRQLAAIDSLRSSIEREHRFKTGFMGYDRQEVQACLDSLTSCCEEAQEEAERLKKENAQLRAQAESRKENEEQARAEERRKLQLEYEMQEGMVASLREKNSMLLAENQEKQVEITALREQLAAFRAIAEERAVHMDALGEKLEKLLNAKLRECSEVAAVWKTEFHGVVACESRLVAESPVI